MRATARRILWSCVGMVAGLPLLAAAADAEFPSPVAMRELVGERLEYRIRWSGIPVGSATMEVGLGPEPWLVEMRSTADSLPVIDLIYPVEDRVVSRAVTSSLRAKSYRKVSREGPRHEHREILFDHTNGAAGTVIDGKRIPYLPVPKDVLDPLSAIYAYRLHPAPEGNPPELPVTDGEKLITARMRIRGLERVTTPAGTFDTVVVEPQIEGLGGIFRRSPNAKIHLWITRDRWRRLVKMETKVAIGSVAVELTEVTEPTGAPPPRELARDWDKWKPANASER
ncbi:MAG: DUF3108 domain-containing protein [Thermoanaerobaculia bacterium]